MLAPFGDVIRVQAAAFTAWLKSRARAVTASGMICTRSSVVETGRAYGRRELT
jgi:hypothetical protein